MSFEKLPIEVQQFVVDRAAESDAFFRRNRRLFEWKDAPEERGRAVTMLSQVSKSLRNMSRKHLFTTLKASKARADIFRFHILETSSDCFTRLVIDKDSDLETLSFVLFFVVPRLPNLRNICAPLHELPWDHLMPFLAGTWLYSPDSENSKERAVASKLLNLSERITSWTLCPSPFSNCLPYLHARPEHLVSLTLGGSPVRDLLASPGAPLLQVLLRCNSLEHLSFANTFEGMEGNELCFHPEAITSPFPFLETLSSFSLSIPPGNSLPFSVDPSVYLFIRRFTKLKHLEIKGDYSTERRQENPRIILPLLETLRIASDTLTTTTSILTNFSLPALEHLSITYDQVLPEPLVLGGEDPNPYLDELSNELRASIGATLKTVCMETECHTLLDSRIKELFHQEARWEDLKVITSWFRGRLEADWVFHGFDEEDRVEFTGVLQSEMENLANWTIEQTKIMESRTDSVGLKRLWEGMETLRQIRHWKEDM